MGALAARHILTYARGIQSGRTAIMYVRISRAHCDPSKCDEVLAAFQQGMTPHLRKLAGYQTVYWAADRARGALIAVSTWDSREHAGFPREALGSANPAVEAALQASGVQMDPPEIYEVVEQG